MEIVGEENPSNKLLELHGSNRMPLAGSCLVCLRLTVLKQVCQVKLHILRFDVPPSQISDVGRSLLGKLFPQAYYCGVFCGKQ